MNIRLVVEIEAQFVSGKFAARDSVVQELIENISDPSTLSVDEGDYEIANFTVDELPEGHCDPSIRLAVGKLLKHLAASKTFADYNQRTSRLRKLLGIPQS